MDNDTGDSTSMNLDLNQEPLDSSARSLTGLGLGSLLSQLETAHGHIEQRIRQLEAVTARARRRQMWRNARNLRGTADSLRVTIGISNNESTSQNEESRVASGEETVERGCKRDRSHLVAQALEADRDVQAADAGGYFDCNICLDMAKEPILTCCGHLFCWPCFYQLPYVYETAKECPVCKGEVVDKNITPIYGNCNNVSELELESGLKVPPRPKAHRVESVRQQSIDMNLSPIPVAEALRRIRMEIGAMGARRQPLDLGSTGNRSERTNISGQVSTSEALLTPELEGNQLLHSQQFLSVLSESANSLVSISSALNNAERLVDLESYIHGRILRGNLVPGVPGFGIALTQHQIREDFAAIGAMHVAAPNVQLQNLRLDGARGTSSTESGPASFSMRRPSYSPLTDVDYEAFLEHRRRRRRLS